MLQRLILSILSGAVLSISWPPNESLSFLIFVALVPLLTIELKIQNKQLACFHFFWYSYLTFFIFNLCTTFWIYHAHFSGAVFAVLCNSFFMSLVFYLYAKIKNTYHTKTMFFLLPILWISFEYLHLNWDLSWPWLSLGNVFSSNVNVVQWFSITGVLGGTLWILLINLLFTQLFQENHIGKILIRKIIIIVSIIILPIFISQYILNNYHIGDTDKSINVLIVQPNIDPYMDKFNLQQSQQTDSLFSLLGPYLHNEINCVLLPETFLIEPIWENTIHHNLDIKRFNEIALKYPYSNQLLDYPLNIFVGATTLSHLNNHVNFKKSKNQRSYKIHNSAVHLGVHLDVNSSVKNITPLSKIDIYHKSKLVPGAEQIPFYNFLKPFVGNKLLQIGSSTSLGNFTKQDSVSLFSADLSDFNFVKKNLHSSTSFQYLVAPIICYESIYGDYVREFVKKGANLIFIITNDGWWKNTPGYKQHHNYAKLRAIETRRYIARSANTGISSVINPFGGVEQYLGWDLKGVIKSKIPVLVKDTFYVRYGDYLGRISSFFAILFVLFFVINNKLIISRK
ncbi:apolipoprotein N-acyltransferase [Flavobacteriales bacterium]|nr:apolipoprotein N-acyltransferase [Flavobacteriales bacterium]